MTEITNEINYIREREFWFDIVRSSLPTDLKSMKGMIRFKCNVGGTETRLELDYDPSLNWDYTLMLSSIGADECVGWKYRKLDIILAVEIVEVQYYGK